MSEERAVDPDCRNASNPFHECSDYCFRVIAEAKIRMRQQESGIVTNMDSSSTVTRSNTHKDKLPKRQKANDGEGIFSKLHEPLISRILSSLSTKDVVRTSVLSKKWRYRWTCITKLDMDDTVLYSRKKGGKQSFVNFVYRALLLTNTSIESFSLVMDNKYDASLVNTWISSVLNRRVKFLRINSHFELSFSAVTSHFLFNSSNLEELVLEINVCAIEVPITSVYFGSLKLLSLYNITFTLPSSSHSGNRTLCFPVLKKFETIKCTWLNAKGIIIKAPLLERVFIDHDPGSLSNELDKCATKFYFSASPLKEFTYHTHGDISLDIVLLDPSSAHNASANIILYECKDRVGDTGNRAVMLLKQCIQAQYLKFEGSEVLAQSRVAVLPSFGMLSHLELGLVTCEVLLGLLLKSPILKTLVFKGLSKFDKELLNSASVPYCFLSTLQMVKFAIKGYEHELCLAKFVFENCLVLERMSFSLPTRFPESKALDDFKEKLFSFKKGSINLAIVEFSYDCY